MNDDVNKPFLSLSKLQLPVSSRLLSSACCPDKDLVATISPQNGKDHVSLWKMQGSKKWEVDVRSDSVRNETIVDLAWSPDGQAIALVHHPPRITVHSIQDGREEYSPPFVDRLSESARLTGVWWFKDERQAEVDSVPDIFKRGLHISGSAHSVIKHLPLLDPVSDNSRALTATQLFTFQNASSMSKRSDIPEAIATWPALPPDFLSASIQSGDGLREQDASDRENLYKSEDFKAHSILVVSDDTGRIHCFLDGSYPLGAVVVGPSSTTASLRKDPNSPVLLTHQRSEMSGTTFLPTRVELPLLGTRIPRDLAKISTSARELLWYAMRVLDEMHVAWFGSGTQMGAREPGIRWLKSLDELQAQADASITDSTTSLLDLTLLLLVGRSSESVSDYIGSGEQMSERGLQKWESTVVEALVKLRDFSELRVAPACQRLHLLLEEILGWSQLPRTYEACKLKKDDIIQAMEMTSRAIFSASWLSSTARRELSRFKEFMKWLRFEIANASHVADPQSHNQPRHDILEVNEYLTAGLMKSKIDAWFSGGVPSFSPQDLGVPHDNQNLSAAIERARSALLDPSQTAWAHTVGHRKLSHLDKNLHSLIKDLAGQCQGIFARAASATARAARCHPPSMSHRIESDPRDPRVHVSFTTREWNDSAIWAHYIAAYDPSAGDGADLCLLRLEYDPTIPSPKITVWAAIFQCSGDGVGNNDRYILLDFDFFDDDNLVVVFRGDGAAGPTTVATVGFSDLHYKELQPMGPVNEISLEQMISHALKERKVGRIAPVLMPIRRSYVLAGCISGEVSLALNGRAGRRVACVLDREEAVLEVLDIEGESDEEEWDVQDE
ncbi:anaphase-promoting complex, cyclosome, subunit 4-domain-containing protein [Russula earlei]|uniref:Anaphase-promoting complex, cyclosome, subunit 4-domain-containing protein n=1 Tax=Russula earlei TaxID=71964 RepID=A0ACC0TYR8_9AGAM|nr:anaphase-promoting complex, cyclosome, subunit 4-domain-containing protein [Russula earlei]